MSPATQGRPASSSSGSRSSKRSPLKRYVLLFVGWVLVPLLVAAGVVASGVHQGAYAPDAWYTRAVRWLVDMVDNLGGA